RAKVDYELERCRVRSKEARFWRSHLVTMNQHPDAWISEASAQGWDIWTEVLGQHVGGLSFLALKQQLTSSKSLKYVCFED
ncbi:MAG: hypothetical protein ACPL5F_13765, partial [Moorellaceae bacterium]